MKSPGASQSKFSTNAPSASRHHADWLSLQVSGPFVSAGHAAGFAQGLDRLTQPRPRPFVLPTKNGRTIRLPPASNAPGCYISSPRFSATRQTKSPKDSPFPRGSKQACPKWAKPCARLRHHRPDRQRHRRPGSASDRQLPGRPEARPARDPRQALEGHSRHPHDGTASRCAMWRWASSPMASSGCWSTPRRGETTGYASSYAALWLEEPVDPAGLPHAARRTPSGSSALPEADSH